MSLRLSPVRVGRETPAEVQANPNVIAAYLGAVEGAPAPAAPAPVGGGA